MVEPALTCDPPPAEFREGWQPRQAAPTAHLDWVEFVRLSTFENLLQGIREAGGYLRGDKKVAARVDRIDPHSVAAIRAKLRLSQKACAA